MKRNFMARFLIKIIAAAVLLCSTFDAAVYVGVNKLLFETPVSNMALACIAAGVMVWLCLIISAVWQMSEETPKRKEQK